VGKKRNIIEINGRRYDAHTGAALDHHGHHAAKKSIAVQHAPAAPAPAHHKQHSRPARKPARPATHHKQQRSTTLMRKAVRKPSAGLKRRVRVQSHVSALVEQPTAEVVPKLSFGAPDAKRLRRASHIKKSQLVTHFNPRQPAYSSTRTVSVAVNRSAAKPAASKPRPKTVPRQPAPDIDDIFDRAIQNATSHLEPSPKKSKKRRLHLTRKHAKA